METWPGPLTDEAGSYPILGYFQDPGGVGDVDKAIYSQRHRWLCQLLRDYRVQAGLRQADVAEALDTPQSFVSKYESGERRLDLVELEQVCLAIGVPIADFVAAYAAE